MVPGFTLCHASNGSPTGTMSWTRGAPCFLSVQTDEIGTIATEQAAVMVTSGYKGNVQLVRTVLLEQWDPIGVRDHPAAHDEYDRYLPAILNLLESGPTTMEIAQHLGSLATDEMGLADMPERDLAAAGKLLQLRFD